VTQAGPSGEVIPALLVEVACAGCGHVAPPDAPFPVRCPRATAGDDVDHVMVRRLNGPGLRFPERTDANPFLRYRELFRAYHLARAGGWSDERYVALVERFDAAIAEVDGQGFRVTPFARDDALSERLGFDPAGGVWIKDETGNVSGSHKARHLAGVMLELLVEEELGRLGPVSGPLVIASCGNAALAAAVVARAAGRRLEVFVPTSADEAVIERLASLAAEVIVCERTPGVPGDPTYHRLLAAVEAGAIPFTCQGNQNGLAIEGGETLGFEIVSELRRTGRALDRIVVQVGGGALASACGGAFAEARALGAIERLPRFDTVQTRGGWPLRRAFERVVLRFGSGPVDMRYVATHRSEFMWPWESEPRSVAHGILDDETYDWRAVVGMMLESGGRPVVVDEATLLDANQVARTATGIDADHTGTAGLAGLVELIRSGEVRLDETVAVIFTGIRRRLGARPARSAIERSAP
jgi:threonine synthase